MELDRSLSAWETEWELSDFESLAGEVTAVRRLPWAPPPWAGSSVLASGFCMRQAGPCVSVLPVVCWRRMRCVQRASLQRS